MQSTSLFCFVVLLSYCVLSNADSDIGRWAVSIEQGNGNVPMYNIYTLYGPSAHYRVFFNSIGELEGDQPNGQAQVSLPSLDWVWTQPAVVNDSYIFDIKATNSKSNVQFGSIEFFHNITATAGDIDIKFDVIITDYTWVTPSSVSDRSIAITYQVKDENDGNAQVSGNDTNVVYNDLYLRVGPNGTEATVTDSQGSYNVEVSLSTKGNGKSITLVYSGFSSADSFDSLVHDPNLGVMMTGGAGQVVVTWMLLALCFIMLYL